jgi:hypothetical protein
LSRATCAGDPNLRGWYTSAAAVWAGAAVATATHAANAAHATAAAANPIRFRLNVLLLRFVSPLRNPSLAAEAT